MESFKPMRQMVRKSEIRHSIKAKGRHLAMYRVATPKFNPLSPKVNACVFNNFALACR